MSVKFAPLLNLKKNKTELFTNGPGKFIAKKGINRNIKCSGKYGNVIALSNCKNFNNTKFSK